MRFLFINLLVISKISCSKHAGLKALAFGKHRWYNGRDHRRDPRQGSCARKKVRWQVASPESDAIRSIRAAVEGAQLRRTPPRCKGGYLERRSGARRELAPSCKKDQKKKNCVSTFTKWAHSNLYIGLFIKLLLNLTNRVRILFYIMILTQGISIRWCNSCRRKKC